MLSVYFGDMPEAIYNTATYFKNSYRSSWITDPYAVSIIKDVDRSDVVSENAIESPVLGSISPLQLSGGVKTLLLMRFDRKQIFNASTCGDNCAKWILDMAKDRKLVVNLYHVMDFGREDFKIKLAVVALHREAVLRSQIDTEIQRIEGTITIRLSFRICALYRIDRAEIDQILCILIDMLFDPLIYFLIHNSLSFQL